jgi:hypothetical protein
VLDEGTTFIFGSWTCVTNSLGGFNSCHQSPGSLRPLQQLDAATSMSYCPPISPATSTRATPGLLKSNSNRYEEATQSKSLFDLEEDLYHLLKIGDEGATACRGGGAFSTTTQSQTSTR